MRVVLRINRKPPLIQRLTFLSASCVYIHYILLLYADNHREYSVEGTTFTRKLPVSVRTPTCISRRLVGTAYTRLRSTKCVFV